MNPETPPPPAPASPKTSPAAVWSLVLGILSCTICPLVASIPGLVLGIIGLTNTGNDQSRFKGRGMALSGTILSVLGVFLVPLITALLIPSYSMAIQTARLTKEVNQVRTLQMVIKVYASDNNDAIPESLDELPLDPLMLVSTLNPENPQPYQLLLSGRLTDHPSDAVFIQSPKLVSGGEEHWVEGCIDGSVTIRSEPTSGP